MKLIVDDVIIDTEECEIVEETERPQYGYFNERVKYKFKDIEFSFTSSKFSNISDYVGCIEDEDAHHNNYFEFDDLSKIENLEYSIQEVEEEIEDCEDDEELKDLKETLKEYREQQEWQESIIPEDVVEVFENDNIGIGASSTQDFNYNSVTIYLDESTGRFYAKEETCENTYKGEILEDEFLNYLLHSYDNFISESIVDKIIEFREIFEPLNEELFKYLEEEK